MVIMREEAMTAAEFDVEISSAGRWGYTIHIIEWPDPSLWISMEQVPAPSAWTLWGARRKARRLLRRRIHTAYRSGTHVISTRMAAGYDPPSTSLNPAAL